MNAFLFSIIFIDHYSFIWSEPYNCKFPLNCPVCQTNEFLFTCPFCCVWPYSQLVTFRTCKSGSSPVPLLLYKPIHTCSHTSSGGIVYSLRGLSMHEIVLKPYSDEQLKWCLLINKWNKYLRNSVGWKRFWGLHLSCD